MHKIDVIYTVSKYLLYFEKITLLLFSSLTLINMALENNLQFLLKTILHHDALS